MVSPICYFFKVIVKPRAMAESDQNDRYLFILVGLTKEQGVGEQRTENAGG
jgi:hypothetical protein